MQLPINRHYIDGIVSTAEKYGINDVDDQLQLVKYASAHIILSDDNYREGFTNEIKKYDYDYSPDELCKAIAKQGFEKIAKGESNWVDSLTSWISEHPRLAGAAVGGLSGFIGSGGDPLYGLGGGAIGYGLGEYFLNNSESSNQKSQNQGNQALQLSSYKTREEQLAAIQSVYYDNPEMRKVLIEKGYETPEQFLGLVKTHNGGKLPNTNKEFVDMGVAESKEALKDQFRNNSGVLSDAHRVMTKIDDVPGEKSKTIDQQLAPAMDAPIYEAVPGEKSKTIDQQLAPAMNAPVYEATTNNLGQNKPTSRTPKTKNITNKPSFRGPRDYGNYGNIGYT